MLLDEFGVIGTHRHIINGHVPVKTIQGENPIKANGKMMVIDGGFSKAYHSETGIAGYTLVYHSRGFQLVQHEPFTSMQKAIEEGQDCLLYTSNFGCFVDIGIKEKGLVHVSQLADKFVSDPTTVVSIHQHVRVKVMSIDLERKRIQLTMKGLNQ